MMNNKTIIILILLIINIVVFYNYQSINGTLNMTKATLDKELALQKELLNSKEKMYQDHLIVAKKNENLKLDQNLKLITIKGDTILAKDAFKKNSLVLRYSILNCGDCIDAEIKNLEMYAKNFSKRIIIITYYEGIRRLILDYKKLQKLGLNKITVYMLSDNKLKIPMDENSIPYYFHINPELSISNILIPIREQPKLSEYYLKYSFKNYFKENN